jgi:hypothetical protein
MPDVSAAEARRSFVVERRLYRRLRNPGFARSIKALVAIEGAADQNGWLILEREG